MSRYSVNPNEEEILPNLLNSNSLREIQEAEFEGFLYAELLSTTQLTDKTKFDVEYIKSLRVARSPPCFVPKGGFVSTTSKSFIDSP